MPLNVISTNIQVSFGGGINPMPPPHLVAENEVQLATNVDFSLELGAVLPRQGIGQFINVTTNPIANQFRNYNSNPTILAGFSYVADGSGNVYRSTITGAVDSAYAVIATGGRSNTSFPTALAAYKQYTLITGNGVNKIDDGTHTTDWVLQTPAAPTVAVDTIGPVNIPATGFTAQEGTIAAQASGTCTFYTSGQNIATVQNTFAANLTTNGTATIGNLGVFFLNIAFSDPTVVSTVSWDFSVGDANFTNFWHAEIDPQGGGVFLGKSLGSALVSAQFDTGTSTLPVEVKQRLDAWSQLAQYNFNPLSFAPTVSNSLNPWAVPVNLFNFVGTNQTAGTSLWANIKAMRVSMMCTDTCTMTIAAPAIYGAVGYAMTDVQAGYSYWQTFVTLDTNGNIINESAPSPAAAPVQLQNARTKITLATPATLNSGINASVVYRQGGFMQDAYAVATNTGTALATITDTLSDLDALTANNVMQRNISPSFPGFVYAISEPVDDRIFIGDSNLLRWTLPGQIGAFPLDSFQEIGRQGDSIQGLIAWGNGLVIINRETVYEAYGNDWENGDFTVTKSVSKHGSLAWKTIIRTPHGIPLLHADGLTMYRPGYNTDEEIPWVVERYGDMFKGNGASSPAGYKGSRIPALNFGAIHESCAAYWNNRLYLGLPCGSAAVPNTIFVLDFTTQRMWWWTPNFNFNSIWADSRSIRLIGGSYDGNLMQINGGLGVGDTTTTGAFTPFTWNLRTREWTVPSDTILENIAVDFAGTLTVKAFYDNSTNPVIATLTAPKRQWQTAPLNGTFAHSVMFDFIGTSANGTNTNCELYGMHFDLLTEPVPVYYHRTPYDEASSQANIFQGKGEVNDKLWDVTYADIEIKGTGTVTMVSFIDGLAVMTNTMLGPTNGHVVFQFAYPFETYGRVAYTTYTSAVLFKPWQTTYLSRPEPPKVLRYRSDIQTGDEHEWKVFMPQLYLGSMATPSATGTLGTCTATVYIGGANAAIPEDDTITVATFTITGSSRHEYTFSLPVVAEAGGTGTGNFGRTIWAEYESPVPFKHYTTRFWGTPEPPRVTLIRHGPIPFPASNFLKTWLPQLDPISGTVTGTLVADDVALTTATFTGTKKQWYTVGEDLMGTTALQTASRWEVIYSATTPFKHYTTELEAETKPFNKATWGYRYHKLGGASQIDMARYWSIFADVSGTCTATYWWDIDGSNFTWGTITISGESWSDRIPMPPGARGKIFEFRLKCPGLIQVWNVNIDLMQEGVKNLTRRGVAGTPQQPINTT